MDSKIISAVMADLNKDFDIHFPVLIGERYIAENDTWPRIVWIPRTDTFGPSEQGRYNPRQLATDFASYDIHIWERDIDSTRALMHRVMGALHRQASAYSYEPDGAEWVTGGELCSNGFLVILTVHFRFPVVDRPWPVANIETALAAMALKTKFPQLEIKVIK